MKKPKYLSQIILMRPSHEDWKALAADPEAAAENLRIICGDVSETVKMAAQMTAEYLERLPSPNSEWGGYLALDKKTSQVVGTCGFKGPPDSNGEVEIAYFTFPTFEGLGCATLMVNELAAYGLIRPQVKRVIATTLPEESASTKVLRKSGFEMVGERDDPEDGTVWVWEAVDIMKMEDT